MENEWSWSISKGFFTPKVQLKIQLAQTSLELSEEGFFFEEEVGYKNIVPSVFRNSTKSQEIL